MSLISFLRRWSLGDINISLWDISLLHTEPEGKAAAARRIRCNNLVYNTMRSCAAAWKNARRILYKQMLLIFFFVIPESLCGEQTIIFFRIENKTVKLLKKKNLQNSID